ncbi:MAG: glutamate-1-semialdehyde 2,1-aminomutase [Candidatus Promineifilaceae bacterium]
MSNKQLSKKLYDQATALMPGGVNSPVRAFGAVGGTPLFFRRGEGAYLTDVDGNRYVDYVLSWGPLILGHADPQVVKAVQEAAALGTSYGAPNAHEIELARLVQEMMPAIELLRFVNSGTEATMSVLRLARAYTGRDRIVKFAGNYHGHADMLLVDAGSGVATLGLPNSPGVPAAAVSGTLSARYNDLDSVRDLFVHFADSIAAVIVEPVAGNMGMVPPVDGFLQGLRDLTTAYGALLIFDEVMSGFRVHRGGAQGLYGITPDLTALGKVIGGGLPVGAYGGRRDIMEMIAPLGPVYQAGTLSGNPLAMAAGIATLQGIRDEAVWQRFEKMGKRLDAGVKAAAQRAGIPIFQTRVGSMQGLFFTETPVVDYETAKLSDTARFGRFFHALLDEGVYIAPSQFEAGFLSTKHGEAEIDETIAAVEKAFAAL